MCIRSTLRPGWCLGIVGSRMLVHHGNASLLSPFFLHLVGLLGGVGLVGSVRFSCVFCVRVPPQHPSSSVPTQRRRRSSRQTYGHMSAICRPYVGHVSAMCREHATDCSSTRLKYKYKYTVFLPVFFLCIQQGSFDRLRIGGRRFGGRGR